MPRQAAVSVDNNFTKGLITEASGLNFPENACTETYNCVFDQTGSVSRRLGIDFELNYLETAITKTGAAISSFLWKNVAGDGRTTLYAIQIGEELHFWDVTETESPSNGYIADTVDVSVFQVSGAPSIIDTECQFASGGGYLFVSHPYCEPFFVSYNTSTNVFTATQINIKVRDFDGVDDDLSIDARPSTLSDNHKYNLLNQGWLTAHITTWDGARADFPSNADVWWHWKDSSDNFSTTLIDKIYLGNSKAPSGHYIVDAFNMNRNAASGLTGLPSTTSGYQRPGTVAFFSGRVFFSGVNYTGYSANIYFSKIPDHLRSDVHITKDFGQCYQNNDPSSEETFDLLPSDGGVIVINDCGTVYKLWPMSGGLTVFATNGIWLITGSQGIGFTANDYTIQKLSSINAISGTSFVDVAGFPAWWNAEGIYSLSSSQTSMFDVKSLTNTTINAFYEDIPLSSKKQSRGDYDIVNSTIQWIYRSTEAGTTEEVYQFDRILNLNTLAGAFYPWSVSNQDVKINSIVSMNSTGGLVVVNDVKTDAGNFVKDDAGNQIVVYDIQSTSVSPKFKYLVSYDAGTPYNFTFAEETDDAYVDWASYDTGVNYTSYFISGYRIRGNAILDAQVNYVGLYADNNSRFNIRGVWDYANTEDSGRWSYSQIVDTTNNANFDVVYKRRKIRGRGKAIQIKIESESGYAFSIVGWSMLASANSSP